MWSDDIDNKIRETGEGSHHVYDDKAWNKMEVLLDKHLPRNRRRFIYLLLLPLAMIGTGVFFALQKQSKNNFTGENTTVVQPSSSRGTSVKRNRVETDYNSADRTKKWNCTAIRTRGSSVNDQA